MTSDLTLSVLRKNSKHYHKQLDNIGISESLRTKNLNAQVYSNWIISTYKTHRSILDLQGCAPAYIQEFIPKNCSAIEADLKSLNQDIPKSGYEFPPITNDDLWIVPIYTLLGSSRGAKIIYNHIKKSSLKLPTHYLQQSVEKSDLWHQFVKIISDQALSISPEELGNYTQDFWSALVNQYKLDV